MISATAIKVNVLVFGQLAEIIGQHSIVISGADTTTQLRSKLHALYPSLSGMQYAVAIDRRIVSGDAPLGHDCTVAILPPFSGG